MGLAAVAMTACEDAPGIAQPEVLPEPPAFTDGDVTISVAPDLAGSSVNLQSILESGNSFNVATVDDVINLPAGAVVDFALQLANNAAFTDRQEVSAPTVDNIYSQASVVQLSNAVKRLYGNITTPATVYYRVPGYVTLNNGIYRIGGSDKFYATGSIEITPIANPVVAVALGENLSTGSINLQDLTENEVENIDLATLTSTTGMQDGYTLSFKYLLSPNQDMSGAQEVPVTYDSESGLLTVTTEAWSSAQTIMFGATGDEREVYWGLQAFYTYDGDTYNVKTDEGYVAEGKINVTPLDVPRHICTPNDSQGWNSATSQWLLAVDQDDKDCKIFTGYAYFGGTWGGKFTDDFTGSEVWYGLDGAVDINPETGVITGAISTSGGNILEGSTAALYWFDVNLETLTFTMTPITSYGIIGNATVGGWDVETTMTPSADFLTWTLETTLTDGEFKFRANNGWDINLGGNLSELTQNGNNIQAPVTGDVTITLELGAIPYKATVVAR